MSKSYTLNGIGSFERCIKKAIEDTSTISAEISRNNINGLLKLLSLIDNFKSCTIVLNLESDEKLNIQNTGVIRTKAKLELISRLLDKYLLEKGITKEIINGADKLKTMIVENKIKILLNIDKSSRNTEYITFKYSNGQIKTIIADINDEEQSICSVTQYIMNEDTYNNLENELINKINSSGFNTANDICNLLDKKVSIIDHDIQNIYDRALFEINKHYIDNTNSENKLINSINKYEFQFQNDGANGLITIILKYGIAYLADSVGLGKTITTLRFLAKTKYKALIITPNELITNLWRDLVYSLNSDIDEYNNIHFCLNSYQELEKFSKSDIDYDIVIFDEAHNFRNTNTLRYQKSKEICAGKLVLLIGATPINNNIADLEAQLMLGLDENKSYDFGVGQLKDYFDYLKKMANKSKKNSVEYKKAQKLVGNMVRQSIISKIMIRRTRKDIEKYYESDLKTGKINFPEVLEPQIIKYKYNGLKLSTTLDILSGYNFKYKMTYAIYNREKYLKNNNENIRELNMVGLTKVRLIKMLDSSPEAFIGSIDNMLINIMGRIAYLSGAISKENYINTYGNSNDDFIQNEKISDYNDEYLIDLQNDIDVLNYIKSIWIHNGKIEDSNIKIDELRKILDRHSDKKIVIFTEFINTANILFDTLKSLGYKVLKVDGSSTIARSSDIINNFSISGLNQNNYNILISTNVLSEGINLNRAGVAINYDITWNPTIITQRVGRLNRIDSVEKQIEVYNFFPCDEMDTAILSESNIISKFALASYSIGTDENYLVSEESDDKDITIMEYKHDIITAISSNITEEKLDFKTVDFRYANEAKEYLDETKLSEIKQFIMISTLKTLPNETSGILGIFSNNGRIITCKKDLTGLNYVEYNDFLDILKRHKDIAGNEMYAINKIKYDTIENMIKIVKEQNVAININNEDTKGLYTIIDALQDGLDKMLELQTINEIDYNRKYIILENIKYNIKIGYLNTYLCRLYKKQYNDTLKNTGNVTIGAQVDLLLNTIVKKKFQYKEVERNIKNNFKIIAIVQLVNE